MYIYKNWKDKTIKITFFVICIGIFFYNYAFQPKEKELESFSFLLVYFWILPVLEIDPAFLNALS